MESSFFLIIHILYHKNKEKSSLDPFDKKLPNAIFEPKNDREPGSTENSPKSKTLGAKYFIF
jgi:hypothetical protein